MKSIYSHQSLEGCHILGSVYKKEALVPLPFTTLLKFINNKKQYHFSLCPKTS